MVENRSTTSSWLFILWIFWRGYRSSRGVKLVVLYRRIMDIYHQLYMDMKPKSFKITTTLITDMQIAKILKAVRQKQYILIGSTLSFKRRRDGTLFSQNYTRFHNNLSNSSPVILNIHQTTDFWKSFLRLPSDCRGTPKLCVHVSLSLE